MNQGEIWKVIKGHFYHEVIIVPNPHASEKKTTKHLRLLGANRGTRGHKEGSYRSGLIPLVRLG